MKIKYKFNNNEVTEVEVSDEIGSVIIESRRKEDNLDRKERAHCYSLDALQYGDKDIYAPSTGETPETDFLQEIENEELYTAFKTLSPLHQRRLLLLAQGLSIREIARREGVDHTSVNQSIKVARKHFLKNFQK